MLPLQESGAKLTSQLAALTALVRSPLEEDARRKVATLVSRDLSTFVAKSSLHVSEQTLHAMLWKRGVSPLITRETVCTLSVAGCIASAVPHALIEH